MTLVEIMTVVAIIGLLASIAMPNFIKFQSRSKQAEAKTNLRAIFSGQRARFGEKDAYSTKLGDISFSPERGNRYSYDLGTAADPVATVATAGVAFACGAMRARTGAIEGSGSCGVEADVFRYQGNIVPTSAVGRSPVTWTAPVAGTAALAADSTGVNTAACPSCSFAAHALGNVDNDSGADELFVSSQFGSTTAGACAEDVPNAQPGSPISVHSDLECDQ